MTPMGDLLGANAAHRPNATSFVDAHYGACDTATRTWVLSAPLRVGDTPNSRFEIHLSPALVRALLRRMDEIAEVRHSRTGASNMARLRRSGGDS